MEFTIADIFQHSPFGDILNSLKSLSLSGEPWPDYGQRRWDMDDEEIQSPPTTHLVATVDNLNDVLNFDSEDIDDMDDDAGDTDEPTPIGHRKATSSHDVYMVDTPKGSELEENGDRTKDQSLEKQSKRRRKRRPKPRLDTNPAIEHDEPTGDEHALEQPSEQGSPDKETEHPSPGENGIPDNLTPDKPAEKKNLHKRLVATARSLKKQKRKLKTAEDALRIRWIKVINIADKYGNSRRAKSYQKRKLLPEFDEEAL